MVRISVIPLDYVTHCDMQIVSKVANKHDQLKHQAIKIDLAWESSKIAVCTKLNVCCLDVKGWS